LRISQWSLAPSVLVKCRSVLEAVQSVVDGGCGARERVVRCGAEQCGALDTVESAGEGEFGGSRRDREVIALRGAVAVAVDDSPFAVLPAKDVGGAQRVRRPNRNCSPRSPRSIRRLRACWLTQAPVG
jgi:hypothetical protein